MNTAAFDSVLSRIVPFPIPRQLHGLLKRLLGIDEVARVYDALRSIDQGSLFDRLLDFLSVRVVASDTDVRRIPRSGPAIVTSNHPFGILDGAVLARMLTRVRPDVRFLANGILTAIPELGDLIIPVDPITRRGNAPGLRRALDHLEGGGMLVVFPAGEVSHLRWGRAAIVDPEWNPSVARLVGIAARRSLATQVVPAHIDGANGTLFQIAGLAHPSLRTALLARELFNKRGLRVEVRIGAPISSEKLLAIPTAREQVDYLRWRTDLLGHREPFKPLTSRPMPTSSVHGSEPVAPAVAPEVLAAEIEALPPECLMSRSGDLAVYLSLASSIPDTLREVGRLREITFRAAGEGAGNTIDLDRFDQHYLHLFVWNAQRREIAGAYRLAPTDTARERGLYTETLFRYRRDFLDRLGPAVELGRSFVRAEYQKGFAPLLLLWKGIGAFIARNPRYKILFGPVSISSQYDAISRELMVGFLEKYAMLRGWSGMVRGRTPFRRSSTGQGLPSAGIDVDELSTILGDVEQKQTGVPVLLRQYLRLGGKLLGFNLDPKFANALDGLILVDLTQTEPKLLERYLGRHEAAEFLAFQKRTTWNTRNCSFGQAGRCA